MSVTNGWGQGAVNNTIEWGKGKTTATNNWGAIYDLSASGDTSLGTAAAFSNTKSIDLDGIDAYCVTDSNYTLADGESKITVSAWIKIESGSDSLSYLFSIGGGSFLQFGIRLQALGTTTCWVYVNNAGNNNRASTSLGAIKGDGLWHHLLVCLDLSLANYSECAVFLDGVSQTMNGYYANSTLPASNSGLHIGTQAGILSRVYGGHIDELAVWVGTDLRNDVATVYNSGLPNDLSNNGLTAPTSWYRFEEGSGTTISDSAGSANASIQNDVTFESDVPT
jgi:hypothetical protein|tara:strand:+ start:885 stop:1724 length:840 start_codon:yes stop_codon:yes gene_type:complete